MMDDDLWNRLRKYLGDCLEIQSVTQFFEVLLYQDMLIKL